MREFNFEPLYRHSVGFDRLANMLGNIARVDQGQSQYPPFNIEKLDDNSYAITLAVAGFTEEDLSIELKEGLLIITGSKSDEDTGTYLHRGIANRAFEKRFQLADHVKVTDAKLENGMLALSLVHELPEALKPRKIEIGSASSAKKLASN